MVEKQFREEQREISSLEWQQLIDLTNRITKGVNKGLNGLLNVSIFWWPTPLT